MHFFVAKVRFKSDFSHPWSLWDESLAGATERLLKGFEGEDVRSITLVQRPSMDASFFGHELDDSKNVALEHPTIQWSREWE